MGSFLDEDLRQEPAPEGKPQPAGKKRFSGEATATLLAGSAEIGWQYLREVPVRVELCSLKHAQLPSGETLFWAGIEVLVSRDKFPDFGKTSRYLTAALDPLSAELFQRARLVPSLSEVEFPDWKKQLRALENGTKRLEDLPFDPFCTDSGWLVGRLGDPFRPHWNEKRDTELENGFLVKRDPNWRSRKQRSWLLGICPEQPDDVAAAIEGKLGIPPGIAPRQAVAKGKVQPGGDVALVREMNRDRPEAPTEDTLALARDAAAWYAMAGRENGCQKTLLQRANRAYIDFYRNIEGRRVSLEKDQAKVRARAVAQYAAFVRQFPDCDRLRVKGQLNWDLVKAKSGDEATERCRMKFLTHWSESIAARKRNEE